MSFRGLRDAVIAGIKTNLVVDVPGGQLNRPFLQVAAAPRRIDEMWLKHVIRRVPSVHVAFIGSARRMERLANGQFMGRWAFVAHAVVGARNADKAETVLLDKLYDLATWIEGQTFDYPSAGPAEVTEVENLWDIDVEKEGFSLGAVAWQMDVAMGTNFAIQEFDVGGQMFPLDTPPGGFGDLSEFGIADGPVLWPDTED